MAERTLEEILQEQNQKEDLLRWKYPWTSLFYNWLIAACLVAIGIGFISWGLDIRTRRIADEMTATAMASYQAEQQAAEEARTLELAAIQASEEHIMTEEAKVIAKAIFGIRRFIEKYGYDHSDIETYARCIFNRCDATGKSVEEVVSQKDQFLGYADSNQLVKEYYDLAITLVDGWHHEEVKPCDSSYQFALLEDDGIWLVKTFNPDGKERRWHVDR